MTSHLDGIFRYYIKYYGGRAGDTFNILRPNYSVVDNTPTLVHPSVQFRMDPASPQFSEPKYRDADWYEMFGDRNLLVPGDIFQKTTSDGGMTPIVTFAHYSPNKACVGFRTTRLCNLTNEINDVIYKNVYFDFLGVGFPGSTVNKRLEDSLKIPNTRVILFNRPNVFRLRTQLIEIDSTQTISKDGGAPIQFQRKWMVEEIDYTGNFMTLTLRSNQEL